MAKLRAHVFLPLLMFALLTACGGPDEPGGDGNVGAGGSDDPGTGGAGGDGGHIDDGQPKVDSITPNRGGPGFRVLVHGVNLNPTAPRNHLVFTGHDGVPSLKSPGVRADAGGKWFEADVPANAQSGPTLVTVEMIGGGTLSVPGPEFTVTDEKLEPRIDNMDPTAVTVGPRSVGLTITGVGFYKDVTKLFIDGKEFPIDWSKSDSKNPTNKIFTLLPEEMFENPVDYEITLSTPEPGGGTTDPVLLRVVKPINLIKVKAVTSREVIATFDQPVDAARGGSRNSYDYTDSRDRWTGVSSARVDPLFPNQVRVTLVSERRGSGLPPEEVRKLRVTDAFRSEDGGQPGVKEMSFRTFGSKPGFVERIGGEGCGPNGFVDPVGVTLIGDHLYVTERGGNQIQVLTRQGGFLGFYAHNGSKFGYHESGQAAGCIANPPNASGLSGPLGNVVLAAGGKLFVGDSGNDRLVLLGEGMSTLGSDFDAPVVALGYVELGTGKGVLVTDGAGNISMVDPATGEQKVFLGQSEPGNARGAFDFSMDEGGFPVMATHPDGEFHYIVEPGNHRVQRFTKGFAPSSSIGKGSKGFSDDATEGPGTENGEFTAPSGIATDANRFIYVIDSPGAPGTGRLQRFSASGSFNWSFPLDFQPGGVAVDSENDILWITDRSNQALVKYELP